MVVFCVPFLHVILWKFKPMSCASLINLYVTRTFGKDDGLLLFTSLVYFVLVPVNLWF